MQRSPIIEVNQHLSMFDRIGFFEKNDIAYVKDNYDVDGEFLPIGFYEKIFLNCN